VHWHVMMGGGETIFCAATYDDGDEAAEAFVDLTFNVFDATMATRIKAEMDVKEQIHDGETHGAYVEGGPLRILWMECDCKAIASQN
jgi:hypothetical protein